MSRLLAVLLLLAPSVAFADAPCKPSGASALTIEHQTGAMVVSTTTLYANGAWTYVEPPAPANHGAPAQPGKQLAGCLDAKTRTTVNDDLKSIPWKVTHPKIHCMAVSPNVTIYSTDRTVRFTKKLCGTDELDVASSTKLAEVERLLATAIGS